MAEYRIKAVIKSEAIFGSGKSKGQIHEDCLYDNDGFIYYNGKTLKGVLRKTAKLISNHYKKQKERIEGLFGAEYDNERKEGKLRFSNLTVSNGMKYKLKEELEATPTEVLLSMTYIRNFIRVENNGVAQDGALRNIRTIREKMVLFCDLGDLDISIEEEKLLALIVQNTRYLGMNVSKGRGEVEMTLLKDNEELKIKASEVIN